MALLRTLLCSNLEKDRLSMKCYFKDNWLLFVGGRNGKEVRGRKQINIKCGTFLLYYQPPEYTR